MSASSELATLLRRLAVGAVAFATLITFLAAMPAAALAHAAEPISFGDWMRTIFVTPDRKIDQSKPALAAGPLIPVIQITLQTSSEQVPADHPVVRDRLPDVWIRRDRWRPRKPPLDPLV
jgi:hypothetical protein